MQLTDSKLPRRSLFAMLPALLTACSALDVLNATVSTDSYVLTEGLAYGPSKRQKCDLYQPKKQAGSGGVVPAVPLVVFFYGGSWSMGNRADYRFTGEALASRGIAVLIADYRLSPEFRYPVFVQDSALAVRWAFDHAAEYGSSPSRVFVMGHSAGAYNAAMLALDKRWLAEVGLSPSRLAGWIGLAGPYDFLPIKDPQTQVAFNWPSTPADSQPLSHLAEVDSSYPPALLLAPRDDRVVDSQRSTVTLASRLEGRGVRVESALFDGVSHVTLLGAMASVLRGRAPVLDRVSAFVASTA